MRRTRGLLAAAGLVAAAWGLLAAAGGASKSRPNVLLVTLDTTRPDRLGTYGCPRDTSPELDRLAAESLVYEQAYSVTSWTLPAHASLFTGKYPASHGANYDAEGTVTLGGAIAGPDWLAKYRVNGLAESQRTLAEILKEAGYATGAVVAGPWLKRMFGLARGFDFYDDDQISTMFGRLAKQVNEAALPWLEAHRDEPFFLFLNYFDPHGPYADPEGLARLFLPEGTQISPPPPHPTDVYYNGTYEGEIRYMDRHIGMLLARLRELGLYDKTLIVVTADHGELIGEHASHGHGFTLYQEELHIPLIVKYPRGERTPARIGDRVQLTDVMPLVLGRLGLPLPAGVEAAPPGPERPIYAEVQPLNKPGWRAWLRGNYKYLWNTREKTWLFDLATDPGESINLAADEPVRARLMETALESFRSGLPAPPASSKPVPVDDETRRALESLGYLE